MNRFQNLWIACLCVGKILVTGRSNQVPKSPQKILIAPAGKLGDVVCSTPVFKAVRTNFPGAMIFCEDFRKVNSPLLAESGLVDGYVPTGGFWSTVQEIKKASPDTVLLLGPGFFMLAASILAGVRSVVAPKVEGGFCPTQTSLYKLLLPFVTVVPYHFTGYAPRERLRVLEPFSLQIEDTTKQLGFTPQANESAARLVEPFAGKPIVGISVSAGNRIKQWPPERFAAVADYCIEKYGAQVILIGGPTDTKEAAEMKLHCKHAAELLDTTGTLSLDELKALMSKFSIFIAVDTGPIYIAEAFDVPTVDIVGPVAPNEQPPKGGRHVSVLPPEPYIPQLHIMNARIYDAKEATRQTEAITTQRVVGAVESILHS